MFKTAVIRQRMKVRAAEVGSNVADVLQDRAKALLEGVCGKDGYVRPGSVELLRMSEGVLSSIDMGRHYEFAVVLRAEVCNPVPGLRFKALVREVNNFGVLAEGGFFNTHGILVPVIEVVLVRETVVSQNEVDLGALKPGDEVGVELLGRRYELRDKRISAFGRAVENVEQRGIGTGERGTGESDAEGGENSGGDGLDDGAISTTSTEREGSDSNDSDNEVSSVATTVVGDDTLADDSSVADSEEELSDDDVKSRGRASPVAGGAENAGLAEGCKKPHRGGNKRKGVDSDSGGESDEGNGA